MSLRRLSPLVLLLGLWACKPTVPNTTPAFVDYAVFELTSSPPSIPQPNDLSLEFAATVPGAQGELLRQFVANGGFPYDQEIPVTVDLVRMNIDPATGATTPSAPDLDVGSLKVCTSPATACNVLVLRIDTLQPGPATIDSAATTYVAGATRGTLTLRNKLDPTAGSRRWPAGSRYLIAIRGGTDGIHTAAGGPFSPEIAFSLLLQGKDLSNPANTPPLPPGIGAQLEQLRQNYLPVLAAVDNFFPSTELAVLTTFQIAPATSWVLADAGAGQVPLPSDFLLDPATGRVMNIPAFGPLAPGLATLDGFSTTAMTLAPTSSPVLAASVAPTNPASQSVFLYEYGPTGPVLVNDLFRALGTSGAPGYLAEPPPITLDTATGQPCASPPYAATCVSTVIGLQPAVPVPTPVGLVTLPPLKEKTEYAVVVTRRVQAAANPPVPISPSTLGQILLFTNPIFANGHSQLLGVSDAQAAGLEAMRLALVPVTAKLQADAGLTKADIAFAYTFRTQTITEPALLLGATPYETNGTGQDVFPPSPYFNPANLADPLNPRSLTLVQAGQKYGVPPAFLAPSIGQFVDAYVITLDLLDPQTGAFYPDPTLGQPTPIPALIALPAAAPPAAGWPLVVFHHGLTRSRADMLSIAGALTAAGMAVAAIDADKHGDRSWCATDADCATGSTCNTAAFGNQGDPAGAKPGLCTAGLAYKPAAGSTLFPLCGSAGAPPPPDCWDGTGGIALSSGDFFISQNLFRERDSVRQDILDQSMLVRVLTTPEGIAVLAAASGRPEVNIDAASVFYVGQSLGSIEGTLDLAANPRFSRAVLNVGGATWVDIGNTSPAFKSLVDALLASLGITAGTPEYLQFVQVAKWVLDPADPANFAAHLVSAPLPNLLANPNGSVAQSPKAILGQAARCDNVVPNGTNEELYGLVGLSPLDPLATAATPTLQWFMANATDACPADGTTGTGGATHGFLLDNVNPSLTAKAQQNAAVFLLGAPVASTPVVP